MAERKLKPDWTWVKFGDVVRLNTERCADPKATGIERYVGLEHIDSEDLQIRRWGQVADGITFTNLFRPGQVLFGKRRAYLRKVAVSDFAGVCSSDIYVFESQDPSVLLPEMLPFVCQTDGLFEYAVNTSAGSLSPRTNWTHLAQYEFALPPLDEQRSLAAALWAYHNTQSTLTKAENALDSLIPGFSAHIMTSHENAWRNVPLGEVAKVDIRKVVLEPNKSYPLAGVLGFGLGLFDNGRADINSTKYRFLHRLQTDQLVLRKITAWESPIALVTPEFDGAFVSPEFPTFSLDTNRISPRFMSMLYKTPQFQREMQARCIGTLVRRKRLYPEALLKIPIILPPKDQQEQIVSQLDDITRASHWLNKRLNALIAVKSTLREGVLGNAVLHTSLSGQAVA